jgi:hypothetical protein
MNSDVAISRIEWGAAILLTILALAYHFMAATSAGGLWRDEANTLSIATLPSLRDLWSNLQNEAFPVLWLLLVRMLARMVGPMNDAAFRVVGFLIGAGITAAIWFNARSFRQTVPLVSLLLFGLAPTMIRWGDSMRAYGLGVLFILITCGLVWRYVEQPSSRSFVLCALASVTSVNLLYYNALLVLAFCSGGFAVCVYRREWKRAAAVILIGVIAAASLLPYVPTFRKALVWQPLIVIPNYTFSWFRARLREAVLPQSNFAFHIWMLLTVIAVIAACSMLMAPTAGRRERQRNMIIFALVTLVVGDIGIFLFLRRLSYYTQPWYYLALLAVTAVCVDALLGAAIRTTSVRLARLAFVLVIATAGFTTSSQMLHERVTDVDLIAARLDAIVQPQDFIIVSPWHFSITFNRYYRGHAPFTTIPPMGRLTFHRYDELRDAMMSLDQVAPVRPINERIATVLQSGHTVYIVGELAKASPTSSPIIFPAAPWPGGVWKSAEFLEQWEEMVDYFLDHHAGVRKQVNVNVRGNISVYERAKLEIVQGWRP